MQGAFTTLTSKPTAQSHRHLICLSLSSVVKARSLPGVETRHSNIDTVNSFVAPITDKVIVRESTEGEYSAIEHESVRGVVECLKVLGHTCTFKYLMIFRGDHQQSQKGQKFVTVNLSSNTFSSLGKYHEAW